MKTRLIIFLILTAIYGSVAAQPAGSLDLTFNGTGKVIYDKDQWDLYWDVKVQPDGKIVAVGNSMSPTYSTLIEVTRYLPDGSFDPSFGTGGHFNYSPNIESGAYKCLIKDDGKILVCGYTTDYTVWYMVILQLDSNGALDPSFGNNGVVLKQSGPGESILYALALQDDGKILAAGYSQNNDYRNVPVVLRCTETGVPDTSFGTEGMAGIPVTETDNDFSAVSVQSDGKIVAAGHISNGLSWFSLLIARFDQNGNLDPGYGTEGVVNLNLNNVDDEFFDLALTPEDEAVLTGFTVLAPDYFYYLLLMKFDTAGQPVASFGNNGTVISGDVPYTFGDALALQTDGKIVITGCTGDLLPANNDWALWRFNSDGSPDAGFGTGGIVTTEFFGHADEALGVALYEDKIIVAGKTRNETDYLDFAVARYMNDIGVSVPRTETAKDLSVSPNPVKRGGTVSLDYELNQTGNVSVELVSILGNSVFVSPASSQSRGKQILQFTVPAAIPAGIYLIRMRGSESVNRTLRLIVTE